MTKSNLATGIELHPSVAGEKAESDQSNFDGSSSSEKMSAGRSNEVISFFAFSFGVFSFGVIHDFVQESVFRVEGFDYGYTDLAFQYFNVVLLC